MKIGMLLPQGYFNEFEGWTPAAAWDRIVEVARLGERLGFDSLWTGEHVLAKWDAEAMVFDCVTIHTAIAALVSVSAPGGEGSAEAAAIHGAAEAIAQKDLVGKRKDLAAVSGNRAATEK